MEIGLTANKSALFFWLSYLLTLRVVSTMLFSFPFYSFLYSGVCSDQLKLSIYDVVVILNISNGDEI